MSVSGTAAADEEAVRDRTFGLVLTHRSFALWQSKDGKTECPQGYNDGPREQFAKLYPEGSERKFAESQLEREAEIVFPDTTPEPKLFFREPVSKVGLGLNLDGKVDENDFTSPDGEKGIDNQMYRVVGCTDNYRGPEGSARHFIQNYMQHFNYNRWLIEVKEVDDLTNDPQVVINLYRGLDDLTRDAAGNFTSGGTQRIDAKWGKEFMYSTTGKIEGGVLISKPINITFPESQSRGFPYISVRDWRLQVSVTADGAEGLMGGYMDLDRWYHNLWQMWSTHHRSYGNEPLPSQYRSLIRNADAYPDEKGQNTHISTAWAVRFSQAFILHPAQSVASAPSRDDTARAKKATEQQ
jgi:hypothetical protein